jgi:flagellar biosynthetic protein FliO
MKAVSKKVAILALFLSCVCWQQAFALPQNESDTISSSAGTGSAGTATEKAPSTQIDQTLPAKSFQDMRDGDMQFPVLRTLGGMGLVICLMIGIYLAAKKFAPRYFTKAVADRNLKVIETLSMGDRRSIAVIEVGTNRFLIGNTPQQINLLATLPAPLSLRSEPESAPEHPEEKVKSETGSSFRNLFEVAKSRSPQRAGNPLPDDIRLKMRQLRDALER